jgi:hypothetical protein
VHHFVSMVTSFIGLTNDDVKTIGAIATSVGVVYALTAPRFHRWWSAPFLILEYTNNEGPPHWDHVTIEDDGVFFLRARVRNLRGCAAAEDVQVLVTSFRASSLGLDTRSLEWSGQRVQREADPVTSILVPPGVERHIDILQIGSSRLNGTDEARLCVSPKPWGGGHALPCNKQSHDLALTVAASNSDAVTYTMSIAHSAGLVASLLNGPLAVDEPRTRKIRRTLKKLLGNG